MDTSACTCARNIIIFISVIVCVGVRGSAAQESGKQRNWLGDSSTVVQSGLYFANMIGKVQLESFVTWCEHALELLRELQDGFGGWYLNDAGVVEDKVRVNNTMVDNEL